VSKTTERLPADLFLIDEPPAAETPRGSRTSRPKAAAPEAVGEPKEQVTIYLPPGDHLRLEEARIELLRRGRGRVTKSDIAAAAIRLATADLEKLVAAL
jgi:hypothetical protein